MPYQEPDYENAFHMDEEGLPGTFSSFAPLLLPIVLILINTVATALGATTGIMEVLIFLGSPLSQWALDSCLPSLRWAGCLTDIQP